MTVAAFTPGPVVCAAQEAPTHAREARTTSPVRIVLRKIIVAPVNTLSSSFHARALGRSQTLDSRVHFGQQTQYEAEARIVSRVKRNILRPTEVPGLVVLDFNHHETMRGHGGTGF